MLARIAGGKDSTFNMMKCVEAGHEVVALANLYPVGREELDSYMYQSVGHDAIVDVAACLGLPLYRRGITGTPRNVAYAYAPTVADEVEDLHALLAQVCAAHPDVQGVSSGAIHSNYQRNRVEEVCARLGLSSVALLWGREQAGLLDEMIAQGVHAVLIKTAVMGLGPADLGRSLQEMRAKLLRLQDRHGVNVCGEGGEFESLTLDCPLYRHYRLEIVQADTITHRDDDLAPVVFFKINQLRLVPKQPVPAQPGHVQPVPGQADHVPPQPPQ